MYNGGKRSRDDHRERDPKIIREMDKRNLNETRKRITPTIYDNLI